MEGKDRAGEGTFRVTFGEEGAAKLGERLTEKLKEYMGEFVDDTLVKYVIVLLGNGRSKEEVKEDLDVFLGDNSDAFVTWLWDHLASHLDEYLPSHKTSSVEVAKAKPELGESADKTDTNHPVSDSGGGKSKSSSKSRHNRDWKGLVTDDTQPPPLRSTIANHVQHEEKAHRIPLRARQSVSPEPAVHRKRNRPDERTQLKTEVSAPRRLLQFAVREAVATAKPSNSVEPVRKRLRSVVATSTANSSDDVHPRRMLSVARLASPMATAIKAVAEAAEDVRKVRTGNVFDRLSRGADVQENIEQISKFRGPAVEDVEYGVYEQIDEKAHQRYLHARGYVGEYNVNASMIDSSTGMASDSASDNEGCGDANLMDCREMNGTETGTSRGYKVDDSFLVQSSLIQDTNALTYQTRKKGNEQPGPSANAKHKIVNISVNVNTWKPPHYQPPREIMEVETRKSMQATDTGAGTSNVHVMKENSSPLTVLGNGKPAPDTQKESRKTVTSSAPGSYSTGRPLEDADLRTVFVNNVHFAATKDSLSRHFNKFGEVLKVIILTDAATGHPKGSAYVEFMRKGAAENALSLDGTSFMSRIIKVVKKSSGQQEANPTMTWPRVTRGSPFAVPRFAQAPFPRVFPGAYRARPPIKAGARSMQWKRDAQPTPAESAAPASGNPANVVSAGRGLTYIRTASKSDGNPGGA